MARRDVNFTQHYSPVTCINPLGPVLTATGHWSIPFMTWPPSTKIGITYTVLKIYQRKQYFLWHTVCMKMLRKLSEKLGAKFPFTTCTLGYSMVRSSCLDDAFSSIFELETIPVEGWQLQQKDKKRRKRVGKKTFKNLDVAYFPSKFGFEHLRWSCDAWAKMSWNANDVTAK